MKITHCLWRAVNHEGEPSSLKIEMLYVCNQCGAVCVLMEFGYQLRSFVEKR